ncbi:MAG: RNA polymerase sigma factor [Candidatus Azambacteria bacterium]|nr:RNA polymerase sigma factor [Candidatus Azambacteria bacterium]
MIGRDVLLLIMANLKKEFSKIYDQYVDKIYRFVFLKVSSQEVAQDITSETFLRGWDSLKNGNNVENPQAFLYQIARNLVTDHYRDKGRAQFVSVETTPIEDPKQDIGKLAVLSSDVEVVRRSLAGLREDYQNVIIWHYLDDLPIPRVAKMLDRSEDATRVLLHRALESLRGKLPGGEA